MPLALLRPRLRSRLLAAALAPWLAAPTARADEPAPPPDADPGPRAPSSAPMMHEAGRHAPPVTLPLAGEPVAWRDGAVHVRALGSDARLWPGGLLQLDARGAFGRGVADVTGVDGPSLTPRLAVRRARLDLSGEFRRSWSFYVSGDFAGTPHLEYAIVDVGFGDVGHLSIGRQLVPVGMANRTFEPAFVGFERPLAVRFAQPSDKDLGALAWGELAGGLLRAEIGVFGGDGGRANVDRAVDAAGRLLVRPFLFLPSIVRGVQIGVSGSDGTRQADRVNYAMAPVTTEGGFAFWRPGRVEGGQALSVIPSGTQQVVDVELWAPIWRFDLRAEYLYSRRDTREAVAGQDDSSSARFGRLKGSSFYASLGFWLVGSPAVLPAPGQFQPRHPSGRGADSRGLLLVVRGEVLDATYDPGSRVSSPGDAVGKRDVRARVLDAGLNYYAGQHAAVLAHYTYNMFPDSSVPQLDPSNLARAPGNLVGRSGAHQVHEVGARVQVSFLAVTSPDLPPAAPLTSAPSTPPPASAPPASAPPAASGSMLWRLGGALVTMRPHQWLKNAFVLAPVFFAKDIFHGPLLLNALAAFGCFCLLAGAVYTMNDLVDVESDRAHPTKRFRPIPSGRVPEGMARVLAVVLVVVSIGGAFWLNPWFALTALAYFVLNIAYSFKLKNVAYLDVACISAGFVLRVVAGGQATGIRVSNYLFVCTALLALFLGFGKRRHELALATRKSLKDYTERGLNLALGLTGLATAGVYLAYTLDPVTRAFFHNDWLWPSTGFTLLGMGRFLQLVTGRPSAESPTQEMLRDVPFVLILLAWVGWVLVTIYQIRPAGMP